MSGEKMSKSLGNTVSIPSMLERYRAPELRYYLVSPHYRSTIEYSDSGLVEAAEDLEFIKQVHRDNGLALASFVFPRNAVGHLDLLARAGLRTFRGLDTGWVRLAPKLGARAGKLVTFADKILPIPPAPARARRRDGLVDIPGSMLLPGRDGARRFILPAVSRAKLAMGLAWARRSGETFHFWFHPCNFYYRAEEQFATLDWFLARAADEASRGRIEICTMSSYAPGADESAGAKAAA